MGKTSHRAKDNREERSADFLPLLGDRSAENHHRHPVEGPLEEDADVAEAAEAAGGFVDAERGDVADRSMLGQATVEVEVLARRHVGLVAADLLERVASHDLTFAATHAEPDRVQEADVAVEEAVEEPVAQPPLPRRDGDRTRPG